MTIIYPSGSEIKGQSIQSQVSQTKIILQAKADEADASPLPSATRRLGNSFRIADPVSIAGGFYTATRDMNCPSYHPIYKGCDTLKAGSVDNLEVNTELTATVVEDEHADAATARVEGGLETVPEVGLVNDGKVLLDITGLGHGNNYSREKKKHKLVLTGPSPGDSGCGVEWA